MPPLIMTAIVCELEVYNRFHYIFSTCTFTKNSYFIATESLVELAQLAAQVCSVCDDWLVGWQFRW